MSKILLRKILMPIAACWFLSLLVLGFLAYFTFTTGSPPTDGLGRELTQSPVLMRILFGQEKMWAGWTWFGLDMLIFWGSIGMAIQAAKWLED